MKGRERRFNRGDELPRSAAGKVLRNRVREPYWAGRARQI
jgi:acyl-CoA synthetase (AMP-forming)/AMP-acid ligase II